MNIFINEKCQEVPQDTKISDLFEIIGISDTRGFAIAVDGDVAPKIDWENTSLSEDAKVLVIKATQGG